MLRPHHGVHRELELGGFALEQSLDLGQLVVGESELAVQRLRHDPMVPADGILQMPLSYNAKNLMTRVRESNQKRLRK